MTKPYNTDIAHVWTRVRRSFVRKGQAFKKDGFITTKEEPKPNYTGSKAGAKLRGDHKLSKKSKEWRTEYLKALELPEDEKAGALLDMLEFEDELPAPLPAFIETELTVMTEEDYKDNPGIMDWLEKQSNYIQNEIEEATALDAARVGLFNSILADKPHDAKAAVDILLKDKLADSLDGYKAALAAKIYQPEPEPEPEAKEEEETDDKEVEEGKDTTPLDHLLTHKGASKFISDKNKEMYGKKKKKESKNNGATHKVDDETENEGKPVDEMLRAAGKSNQDVVTDSPVKGKKKK